MVLSWKIIARGTNIERTQRSVSSKSISQGAWIGRTPCSLPFVVVGRSRHALLAYDAIEQPKSAPVVLHHVLGKDGQRPLVVLKPETVADLLQEWVEETDVDGFNLAYALTHETFIDAVELLVPELQKRGVYKTEYAPGTLREKLFGEGPRLPQIHPGSGYRDLAGLRQQERKVVSA